MTQAARDPTEVANTIKLLRQQLRMKAETLAELSGLSVRSIERAESGRHLPNEHSLAHIARALGVPVGMFDPIDEAAFRKQLEQTQAKTVVVPMAEVDNPAEVMAFVSGGNALQHELSEIRGDEALDAATALAQTFFDAGEIWDDIDLGGRLDLARGLIDQAKELRTLGYKSQMGTYRARHLAVRGFTVCVKLVTFLPIDHPGTFALVTLPSHLETLPEDRIPLPSGNS